MVREKYQLAEEQALQALNPQGLGFRVSARIRTSLTSPESST